ncbi:SCO2400 family protein [Streptomyces sp. NPDC004726]
MDFCHQCRRHLNGALACAGCGTPAEELRQRSPGPPEGDRVFELDVVSAPVTGPTGSARGVQAAPRRAGRKAPPHARDNRRRAAGRGGRIVVIGSLGLALAAGALGIAEVVLDGGDGAATSVKEDTDTESAPAPAPTDQPRTSDSPAGVTERPTGSPGSRDSVRPVNPSSRNGPPGTAPAARPGTPRPTTTSAVTPPVAKPSASTSPTASSPPAETEDPEEPDEPWDPRDPRKPRALPRNPAPTPVETCERFLWWCV